MGDKMLGSVIAVDCGSKGYFQGKLAAVDPVSKSITLSNAFNEGVPVGKSIVLAGPEIVSLKVIKTAEWLAAPAPVAAVAPMPVVQQQAKADKKKAKMTDRSSSTEDDAGGAQRHKQQPKERRKKRVSPPLPAPLPPIADMTPTPLFRSFEPQVAQPQGQSQEVRVGAAQGQGGRNSKRGKAGPSGIPSVDAANGYGRTSQQNRHLDRPLAPHLVHTDFDFEEGNEVFRKEVQDQQSTDDAEFYEQVEKLKVSKNFKHTENIVADPNRITSWTNVISEHGEMSMTSGAESSFEVASAMAGRKKKAVSGCGGGSGATPPPRFPPLSFRFTADGERMPVLAAAHKKAYLRAASEELGGDVLAALLADRMLTWLLEVIAAEGVLVEHVVVLAGASTLPSLTDSFLRHLSNRAVSCFVVGRRPSRRLPHVCSLNTPTALPEKAQVVVDLEYGGKLSEPVHKWLAKQTDAHVLRMEGGGERQGAKTHSLYIGALTDSLREGTAAASVAVCDVGIPFDWLEDDGCAALARAFATKQICTL